jgi:flagellar hook protein FlgE
MSFRTALSGLNAASTDLEVTGNNIANSATNGFKESRAEFADVFAASIQDTANQAGQGVKVARIAQQFSQGTIDFTSNNLDLAISGQGFFVLEKTDGTQLFTRAGAYSVDREGYVVNGTNDRLQVFPPAGGDPESLQLPTTPNSPNATADVDVVVNVNASATPFDPTDPAQDFDEDDPSTYHSSTSTTIYDSLGNSHVASMYFRNVTDTSVTPPATVTPTWESYLVVDGDLQTVTAGNNNLVFDGTGALTGGSPKSYNLTWDNGAIAQTMDIDFTGTTQFGSPFAVNNLAQDGYTTGRLSGVDIDATGVVFARYTNGQSTTLGQVALAKFANQQGLTQTGDTNWAESFTSGQPQIGVAGTSSFGQIQSGALEASNVDIAEQLVNLIMAQRNFQANAEVISTADSVTQTIINIR